MSNSLDLQRMIADAWAAGYAARETELVCRRRSSLAQRQAEIDRLTERVLASGINAAAISASDSHEIALSN